MKEHIERLTKSIAPLRDEIINHPVYSLIKDKEDLKVFMKYHVFAVWDFMSLLKSLQNNLTCTSVPWFPVGNADTRYLINEIVLGEESDTDANGLRKSHFELYIEAMKECGADTSSIEKFHEALKLSGDFESAFRAAEIPPAAQAFVEFTFQMIGQNKPHILSAIFTYGREDLIPGMFLSIIQEIHKNFPEEFSIFKYYIERHIEVDGDHHKHLATQMTANLCGDDDQLWHEAELATIQSLEMRKKLWDGVHEELLVLS
jgi:Protein of unknown function (DUF3050)